MPSGALAPLNPSCSRCGRAVPSCIVPAKSIERDEDDVVLRLLRHGIRRIRHRDHRRRVLRHRTSTYRVAPASRSNVEQLLQGSPKPALCPYHALSSALKHLQTERPLQHAVHPRNRRQRPLDRRSQVQRLSRHQRTAADASDNRWPPAATSRCWLQLWTAPRRLQRRSPACHPQQNEDRVRRQKNHPSPHADASAAVRQSCKPAPRTPRQIRNDRDRSRTSPPRRDRKEPHPRQTCPLTTTMFIGVPVRPRHRRRKRNQHRRNPRMNQLAIKLCARDLADRAVHLLRVGKIDHASTVEQTRLRRHRIGIKLRVQSRCATGCRASALRIESVDVRLKDPTPHTPSCCAPASTLVA